VQLFDGQLRESVSQVTSNAIRLINDITDIESRGSIPEPPDEDEDDGGGGMGMVVARDAGGDNDMIIG
jgi:hypothetical protein